jgi:TonB family protein
MPVSVLNFVFRPFEFVSDFVIRVSSLALLFFALNVSAQDSGFAIEMESSPSDSASVETVYVDENGDTLAPESLAQAPKLDKLPELTQFIEAVYPPAALRQGVEGAVVCEFLVTDSGQVDSLRVIKSLTPDLDTAALRAITQFVFTPAMAQNKPVPVFLQYEYRFSLAAEAQKIEEYINFSGQVREKGTRAPVKDAMVVITFPDTVTDTSLHLPWPVYLEKIGGFAGQHVEEGRLVAFTDSLGQFVFKSLPACSLAISLPVAGYLPFTTREQIAPGQKTSVTYWIERTSYDEYEIVVYGKTPEKEVAKQTLNIYEVKKIPGFGGDAIKVIQALPGVARPSFISGEVIVRGAGGGDTRYFLEGVEIPGIYHFGGLRSTYNSDLMGSLDFYPGGFNVRYGGCIGGVAEIKGRPAKADRWHGNVDVNVLDASFVVEGPITPKLTLQLSGRRSYIANMINWAIKTFSGINLPMTVVPYYWDALARLDYKMNEDHRFFIGSFSSQDIMKFIIRDVRGGSTEVDGAKDALSQNSWFQGTLCGYDAKFSPRLSNKLRVGVAPARSTFNAFGFFSGKFNTLGGALRDELSYKLRPNLTLNGGIDATYTDMDYVLKIVGMRGVENSTVHTDYSVAGAYALAEYRPWPRLLIMPGLRYDYFAEIDEGTPALRIGTQYELDKFSKLKASAGTYSQGPRPFGQSIDPKWGNPELPYSSGRQYVLGYERQLTDLIYTDVQTYYNTQDNLPATTSRLRPNGKPYNYLPDMDARMYGLEILLRHNQGKRFFGWISYTLSRSERRTQESPDQSVQGAWDPQKWFLFDKDQPHHLQALGTWKLPYNFETGFRFRFVSGNPETPNLGYTEHRQEYNADYFYYPTLSGDFRSDRMGPFVQMDLRIDKKIIYKNWIFSTYLDVINTNYPLYNSPEFYNYSFNGYERQTIGGIIIPSFGLRAEF